MCRSAVAQLLCLLWCLILSLGGTVLVGAQNGIPSPPPTPGASGFLPPTDATYVASATPEQTYNGAATFLVRRASNTGSTSGNACIYLKFALGNQFITTAFLNLRVDSSSAPSTGLETVKLYAIPDTTWTADTLKWSNASTHNLNTGANWGSTGGLLLSQQSVSLQGGTAVSFDVTSYVRTHQGQTIAFQLIDEANPPDNRRSTSRTIRSLTAGWFLT
ncbi:MAG TPA: DNRLRE domain-containing protein [Chthonomonadaceae bacterium]|nr:DNRLRE domain-containing protein [Chthonomonadaceae bacterium]